MKFELNVNCGVEEIIICGNVDTAIIVEILNTHAELSEYEYVNPKEESDCDKQDRDVLEEGDTSKIVTLKELSEIFHNTESAKDKMLEADPNIERIMHIHLDVAKMLVLHGKL